jgi:hypothetical protein
MGVEHYSPGSRFSQPHMVVRSIVSCTLAPVVDSNLAASDLSMDHDINSMPD